MLARLLPDGSLDPTFGTDGFVRPDLSDIVYGVDVQPDGRILAAGSWPGAFGMQPWLGRFLGDELAPRGREEDAVGREHYELASRYFLGAVVDLEETYAWGWEELHRIETEMQAIAESFVPGGSIADAARHLDERGDAEIRSVAGGGEDGGDRHRDRRGPDVVCDTCFGAVFHAIAVRP